jgi:hypothetical protein
MSKIYRKKYFDLKNANNNNNLNLQFSKEMFVKFEKKIIDFSCKKNLIIVWLRGKNIALP